MAKLYLAKDNEFQISDGTHHEPYVAVWGLESGSVSIVVSPDGGDVWLPAYFLDGNDAVFKKDGVRRVYGICSGMKVKCEFSGKSDGVNVKLI